MLHSQPHAAPSLPTASFHSPATLPQHLPDHAANRLLALLLGSRVLSAAQQLEPFRLAVTVVAIPRALAASFTGEWVAYLAHFG